jgi:hypothetical protein
MIRLLSSLFFGQKNILALTILLAIATPCLAQKYLEVYQDGNLAGSMFSADIDSISFTGKDTASRHINFWSKGHLTNSFAVNTVDSIMFRTESHETGSTLAQQLHGTWQGDIETSYFDWRGVKVESSGTAEMTFILADEAARSGTGIEVDYQDGKQVYWMPFTWSLEDDLRLRLEYSDHRKMISKECTLSGDSLTLILIDATDGLETCIYHLTRKN